MQHPLTILAPLLCLLLWAGACTAETAGQTVYRWTDENGQVHYGTKPPSGEARRILMRSPEAVSNDAKSEEARAQMRQRMLESFQREREIKATQKQQAVAEQRQRELRCSQLQRRWANLNHYGPIYYESAQGGRRFLNEEERQAEKDAMRERLVRECGEVPEAGR